MKTMQKTIRCLALACCLPLAAQAQDGDELPGIRSLGCASICANSTPAVTTDTAIAKFPAKAILGIAEGYVQVVYTIGTDGVVKDIVLLHLVGPQAFADSVFETLKKRKYIPGTLNGQPVEQSRSFQEIFNLGGFLGARSKARNAYNQSLQLLQQEKVEEAGAMLASALAEPNLTFYERGMLSSLTAIIADSKKDYYSVRNIAELPTTHYPTKIPLEVLKSLTRNRIMADLHLGDIDDAVTVAERYQKMPGVDPADPIFKVVEDTRAKADALPQLAILKKMPAINEGGGDYFPLNRRTFSFTLTSGSLDKFSMNCRQQTIESKITANAEWHVPKDWDNCYLLVMGTPGTTYQLNLFAN